MTLLEQIMNGRDGEAQLRAKFQASQTAKPSIKSDRRTDAELAIVRQRASEPWKYVGMVNGMAQYEGWM